MEEYANISQFLDSQSSMIEEHIRMLTNFLVKEQDVSVEYLEQEKLHTEIPFNVFMIASDLYYRENFHSDVISVFLDTNGKHGEGSVFLDLLIDILNKDYHKHISKLNYRNSEALREYGKIDILVRSKDSKHCIIIENKINNAGDMPRQLPRYYDKMTNEGYTVDAILYLPLDKSKAAREIEWSEEDKEHIRSLYCKLPAYSLDGKANLVDSWILPCTTLTNNIYCIATLKQYADLVKQLNTNNMNSIILEKFYSSLTENAKNVESAKAVSEMLVELPTYMADRLVEIFKDYNSHFKVWKYKPDFCGFIFHINESEYKIDILPSINGYDVSVFEQTETGGMDCLEGKTILKDFALYTENRYNRQFAFDQESILIDWIKQSLDEIKSMCD